MCVVHEENVAGWRALGDQAARAATLLSWNVREDWRNAPDRLWFRGRGDLARFEGWLDEVLPLVLTRLRSAWLDRSRPAVLTRWGDLEAPRAAPVDAEPLGNQLRRIAEPMGLRIEWAGGPEGKDAPADGGQTPKAAPRAQLHRIHCAEVVDLSRYAPPDPRRFSLHVQLLVGPAGEPSASEAIGVEILTPSFLEAELEGARLRGARGAAVGHGRLFVLSYDYAEIEAVLRGMVGACEGETWAEVAVQLARLGHGELDGYRALEHG